MIYVYFNETVSEKKESFIEIDTVTLTDSIINMPEFNCNSKTNCMDTMKILSFNAILQDPIKKPYYRKLFENKQVELKIISDNFPSSLNNIKCDQTKFNQALNLGTSNLGYPLNCDYYLIYEPEQKSNSSKLYESAALAYFPSLNKYSFSILKIRVYQEK